MPTKLLTDFKHDDVFFHPVTFNQKGQKNVNLSFDKESTSYAHRIQLQLCKDTNPLIAKWNLSTPREGEDGTRRNWEIYIDDPESIRILKDFDTHVKAYAKEHSREWFKKDLNPEQINDRYKSIVKEPKENETMDYIILKVNCPPKTATPIKKLLEDGKTLVDGTIDDLTKDAKVVPIVSTSGVWFMSDSFGISLSAYKLIVQPINKKSFMDHFHLSNEYNMIESPKEDKDLTMQEDDEDTVGDDEA